jgi:GAF domain-containing protein
MKASIPLNEAERLAAVRSYEIVDTAPEEAFNDITHLASYICQCPIATISIIEEHRQWYKAAMGINMDETPRGMAFCSHTILQTEMLVVSDATKDSRFADNPAVTKAPFVRFYAGLPLINPEGFALGTLCVVDTKPRELTFEQVWALESLRRHVVAHLELRRTALQLEEAKREIAVLQDVLTTVELQETAQSSA